MLKLTKEKTESTPYIFVDEEVGYMRFQGESFHQNVMEYYGDVVEWLQIYLESDFASFTFDCELKYFNSSSAKMLLNMLLMMDEASARGKRVVVNWITTSDNEISIESGEDFSEEVTNLTFNMVIQEV